MFKILYVLASSRMKPRENISSAILHNNAVEPLLKDTFLKLVVPRVFPYSRFDCSYILEMSSPKQYKIHGFLAHVIELFQIAFHDLPQLTEISNLHVRFIVILRIRKITTDQASQVVLGYNFGTNIQVLKHTVEIDFETPLHLSFRELKEPRTICIIHEPIIVNAEDLRGNAHVNITWAAWK